MSTNLKQDMVFVVDGDSTVRKSIEAICESIGLTVRTFHAAEEFLDEVRPDVGAGCLVVDIRLPGMSGLDLLDQLASSRHAFSILVVTAYADTPLIVRAMRSGAFNVLDKPCKKQDLHDNVTRGLVLAEQAQRLRDRLGEVHARMESLTPHERQVLELVLIGSSNKAMANQLQVSVRTIESRRQRILAKMAVGSIVDLVRTVVELRIRDELHDLRWAP